jgi:pyruvate dehydrogenase E2 component (dihydrolipoamide acetyltransferase)
MAHPVRMPKPGQMTEECTITRWHKVEGDPVRRGDALFEIETDKATMDVEAFDEGVLLRRLFAEGDTVPVNTICAYIGEPGEAVPETEAGVGAGPIPALAVSAAESVPKAVAPAAAAPAATEPAPATPTAPAATPTAPAATTGTPTPPQARPSAPAPQADHPRPAQPSPTAPGWPTGPSVSPRAARLARARGIDLVGITGTGPGGRIVERDVLAAASRPSGGQRFVGGPAGAAAAPSADEAEPRPLGRIRRVIAERLAASWPTTPQFSVTVAADVSSLMALRRELRDAGHDLSVTDFVLAATAQTLVEFPDLNARTDGNLVWPRRRVHLGLAVAVPGGLLVPVIRDADAKSLLEIHETAARLVAGARAGALAPDELTGSTFTVSNLGMLGVESFAAIVNPGEAAILAVGSATSEPVAVGDGIGVRTIMRLTLSADHRLVDGELAARFLGALRRRLADLPGWRALLERG